MISIIYIVMVLFSLMLSSLGYGKQLLKKRKWHTQLLMGAFVLFGIVEIIDLICVPFYVSTTIIFTIYTILLLVGMIFLLVNRSKTMTWKEAVFLLVYVIIMAFIHSNRAIGEPSFDSSFYLSHVIEGTTANTFGGIYDEYGSPSYILLAGYDFQGFYHLHSYFLMIFQNIQQLLHLGNSIVSHISIWSSTLFLYVLLLCFTESVIDTLKVEKKITKWMVRILLLGFIGNYYWNNSLAFYGNTYRQLGSAVMAWWLFEMIDLKEFSLRRFVFLSMILFSLISFSSSALFIGFIAMFSFICLSLQFDMDQRGIKYILIVLPLAMYALVYYYFTYFTIVVPLVGISLFFAFCLVYDYVLANHFRMKLLYFLKKSVVIVFPVLITLIAIYLRMENGWNLADFFKNYSSMDMVWDYFRFNRIVYFVLNVIYLIGLGLQLINKRTHGFSWFLGYTLLCFINPVNIIVVEKFLSYVVFYRAYEVVLNYFTCILALLNLLAYVKNEKVQLGFLTVLLGLSLYQASTYYHHYYCPSEKFNKLYKVDEDELDMLNVFNDLMTYEKKRATVVSQMDSIKGFIPNISLSFGFREVGQYSINEGKSDLLKVFYPRNHAGQQMFDEEPDFHCACDLLIQHRVDYVIIDKEQVYLEGDKYEHIYYLVRDCAELAYENEQYALFRFYWD